MRITIHLKYTVAALMLFIHSSTVWGQHTKISFTDTTLSIMDSTLISLPNEIISMKRIKYVSFTHCKKMDFENALFMLSKLDSLKSLSINSSNLPPMLFSTVGLLTHLEKIDLRANNIETLPPNISELKELRELDLSDNEIHHLPSSLMNLRKLSYLLISNNKINNREFEDILKLIKKMNIEWLDVGDNYIDSIPDNFCSLKRIAYIAFYGNSIKKLPECIFDMPLLTHVNMGNTSLSEKEKERIFFKFKNKKIEQTWGDLK